MKRMVLIMLLGAMAFPLTAQTLTGKWVNAMESISEDDMTGEGRMLFQFQDDGTADVILGINATMTDDDLGEVTIVIDITIPGQWTREGDVLNLNVKKRKATVKSDIKGLPGDIPAFFRNQMAKMLKNEISKELLKDFDAETSFIIIRLTESELELEDIPAKGEAAERQVFTRMR